MLASAEHMRQEEQCRQREEQVWRRSRSGDLGESWASVRIDRGRWGQKRLERKVRAYCGVFKPSNAKKFAYYLKGYWKLLRGVNRDLFE